MSPIILSKKLCFHLLPVTQNPFAKKYNFNARENANEMWRTLKFISSFGFQTWMRELPKSSQDGKIPNPIRDRLFIQTFENRVYHSLYGVKEHLNITLSHNVHIWITPENVKDVSVRCIN